jgi:hypothetical protein
MPRVCSDVCLIASQAASEFNFQLAADNTFKAAMRSFTTQSITK